MMRIAAPLAFVALAACGAPTTDQAPPPPAAATADRADEPTEAMRAYAEVNEKMHAGMGGAIDRDPDVAFVRGMIPHHQGAIDMARVVLEHGRDGEVRALAQSVIGAQEEEIARMRAWLGERGLATDAPVTTDHGGHR